MGVEGGVQMVLLVVALVPGNELFSLALGLREPALGLREPALAL